MNTLIKYVVTDPCYILSDDKWDECCKFLDDSPKAFNEAVSKALTDLSGFPAFACDTGFGVVYDEAAKLCIGSGEIRYSTPPNPQCPLS